MSAWKRTASTTGRERYERDDGAAVMYQGGPAKQQYIAFEPDPSEAYLIRRSRSGKGWPRRWASPEAAMRAVDREYRYEQLETK